MKVLWLTNTPSLAAKYVNEDRMGGGWIASLDTYMQNCLQVDLHIMFLCANVRNSKKIGNTTYHPVYNKNKKKLEILINRFTVFSKRKEETIIKEIKKRIIQIDPDIIHIHGTENIYGLAVKGLSKPAFISLQGNITVCRHKFFTGIHPWDVLRSVKIKDIILGTTYFHTWKEFKKASQVEKDILKAIPNIIGRTEWDRRISLVLNPQRRYFFCNEILRCEFYKNEWNNPYKGGVFRIFTTNGPALFKGFETICQALILLNGKIDVEWNVAGLTEFSPVVRILKKKLRRHYPVSNLNLVGIQDESSLISGLLNTHLYVMPSHIENSPNNLCEAQILGVPCIATNAGGTSSLITNTLNGFLIQDGDPWHLAGAIIEVQRDYEKIVQMAQRGRFDALIRHNPVKVIEKLIKIYKSANVS